MASIEVADKIMPFGKYMVASEDITPANGWNYSAVLSNLTKYPSQDGLFASKTIANSFAKHSTNPIDIQGITISVISLERISQSINEINNLSNHLLTTVTNVPSSLLMATAADSTSKFGEFGTNRSGQVDLSGLLFHIREKFPVLGYIVDNTQKSLKNALLYNIKGESKPNATGLSIYMPTISDQFNSYSSNYALNAWQNVATSTNTANTNNPTIGALQSQTPVQQQQQPPQQLISQSLATNQEDDPIPLPTTISPITQSNVPYLLVEPTTPPSSTILSSSGGVTHIAVKVKALAAADS